VVDRRGIPLAVGLTGANRPDQTVFAALLDAVAPIKRPRGRPRQRPAKLHADKGYDYPPCRAALRQRGLRVRIARKGVESTTRLGQYRWVAERTLAWQARFRRLTIRYERRDDIHQAFLDLGCALICLNALHWPARAVVK
jgi:IS5 family transposase